jgi:hypothetical protein
MGEQSLLCNQIFVECNKMGGEAIKGVVAKNPINIFKYFYLGTFANCRK